MKIIENQETKTAPASLFPPGLALGKKELIRGASMRLSFETRFLEVLRASGKDAGNKTSEAPKAPVAAPKEAPRDAKKTADVAEAPRAAENGPARTESKDSDVAQAGQGETETEAAAQAEADEGSSDADASQEADAADEGTEAVDTANVERIKAKEIRFEAHVALARSLTREELDDLKAGLRKILDEIEENPGEAAGDFVALVADLVGSQDKARETLVIEDPEDLLKDRKFFRKILTTFEKSVRRALENQEETPVARTEAQNASANEAGNEERAKRIVARIAGEVAARKSSEAGPGETAKVAVTTAEPKAQEARTEAVLPKRQDAPASRRTGEEENLRRTEANESQARGTTRTGPIAAEVIYLAEKKVTVKAEIPNGLSLAATQGKVDGVSEARAGGQNQGAFWQSAYDNGSKRADGTAPQKAAHGAQAPMPHKDAIFSQIVREARMTLTDGKGEATIRLKPEFLGKVEIKVTVEEGKAQVQVRAETSGVTRLLTENLNELRNALEATGLEVNLLDVSTGQGDLSPRDERNEEEERIAGLFPTSLDEEAEGEPEERILRALSWDARAQHEYVA